MFIAVNADNGFGVYDSKTKLEYAKEWMKNPKQKEYETKREASFYAIETYNDYHNAYSDLDEYYEPGNDPYIRINWFY